MAVSAASLDSAAAAHAAGRLARRLGKLGEGGERAAHVAAPAIRLDLGHERLRIVARRLVQVAHLNEAAQMGEKAVDDPACSSDGAAAARTLDRTPSKAAASAPSVGAPSTTAFSGASFAGSTPRRSKPRELRREGRAADELVAQRVGDDRDRGGIVAGRGLLRRDPGLALRRRELRFDLVEAGGDAGEIGRRRLRRAGFQFRHPRAQTGDLAPRGVDIGAQILHLPRHGLRGLRPRRRSRTHRRRSPPCSASRRLSIAASAAAEPVPSRAATRLSRPAIAASSRLACDSIAARRLASASARSAFGAKRE